MRKRRTIGLREFTNTAEHLNGFFKKVRRIIKPDTIFFSSVRAILAGFNAKTFPIGFHAGMAMEVDVTVKHKGCVKWFKKIFTIILCTKKDKKSPSFYHCKEG
jgi:hypothetical protein